MTYVLHKGRPLTAQTVADLNVYFALVQRHQPIPKPLWERLHDAGVESLHQHQIPPARSFVCPDLSTNA